MPIITPRKIVYLNILRYNLIIGGQCGLEPQTPTLKRGALPTELLSQWQPSTVSLFIRPIFPHEHLQHVCRVIVVAELSGAKVYKKNEIAKDYGVFLTCFNIYRKTGRYGTGKD